MTKKSGWSISQGQCWATNSNTPFRKYKIFVHEGGISSPFIVHWPAGIARKGRIVNNQIFHLVDIMPTLCEMAGTEYPDEFRDRQITPTLGVSVVPYWKDEVDSPVRRTLYWQHTNHSAIRDGDWKLVTLNDRDATEWQLHDLSNDRSETDDMSSQHPEIVQQLRTKWHTWAKDVNVLPFPEQRGKPQPNRTPEVPK